MLKSLLMKTQKNHRREYLNGCKQTINRNLALEDTSDEEAEGDEAHVIRNWRKLDPCYIMGRLADL